MATNTLPASRHAGSPSGEEVLKGTSARGLIEEDSGVHGVRYRNRDGLHEVRASSPSARTVLVVATVDEAPAEPSLNDVQALLDARGPRTLRTRVEEVIWSSRFRVAHKVAARFREGNVFLCGDAAHVHSPAGGQGMNTGIQDAANLAWKLALVLRGHADEGAAGVLLDSYEVERRQVALCVVSTTHRLTRLATVRSPVARRLRNALLAVAGLDGRLPRRLAANLAEVDIVYRGGWSADGSNTVERWIPEGGKTAAENQDPASGPAFRLLVPEGHEAQVLDAAARFPGLPVRVVPVPGVTEASLVRPDGYVAGRSGAEDSTRLLGLLAQALGATLLDLFRAWHYTVRMLIEATAEEAIRSDDPYDREPLPTGWGMGRVTLLGDARPPDNAQAWTGRSPGNRGQGGAGAVPQGAPRRRPRENPWRT